MYMNINCHFPINRLSYGVCARNIANELSKVYNISLFPIGPIQCKSNETENVQKWLDNAMDFRYNDPCLKIYHQFALAERIGKGKFVSLPFFELDSFTKQEVSHLNSCDFICVASEWAKEICKNNKIQPEIAVSPLGVDRSIFYESSIGNSGPTIFLCIGKFEHRKHSILMEVFNSAFDKNENVLLLLLAENPFLSDVERNTWQNNFKHPKVRLIPKLENDEDVANLIRSSHCGVYLSKAEAWGLPILDTLSCGRHLIVTNYSGQTEYCNKSNSRLIDINELEIAHDGKWFKGTGRWAKLGKDQIEQTVCHMREIHKLHKEGKLELNTAGIETAKQFSWQNTARKIIEIL